MTDNPTPPPSDEEPLVHVGWWCWRGDNHGHLATMACRSDNVPLHVPAEWADEMRAVIQRIEDGDEDEEQPAVLPAVPVPPTTATDRAAVLREAADAVAAFTGNQLDANAKMLRRMADEAQQPGADRCSGCRYVPCGQCHAAEAQQQPDTEAWDVPDARPGTTDYTLQKRRQQPVPGPGRVADEEPAETPCRCVHNDIVYGRCVRPALHDGECFHERQSIRIGEETDDGSLCSAEYPGDDNFVGQLCGLPARHYGDHRCDVAIGDGVHTVLLRWRNEAPQ